MKRFELTTRGHIGADFNMKCMNHNGLSGVGKSYDEVEVLGRDFPIIVDKKTRSRFMLKIDVLIDSADIHGDAIKIKKWLMNDLSDQKIELSDMAGYYFMGFFDNKLDIEEIIGQVGGCTLNFNCQPYIRQSDGDSYATLSSGGKLTNLCGTECKPLIRVTSTGIVKFKINEQLVELRDTNGVMYIDCELMDAYVIDGNGVFQPQNHKMYSDFPLLETGDNIYTLVEGAITKMEIMPRWRVV